MLLNELGQVRILGSERIKKHGNRAERRHHVPYAADPGGLDGSGEPNDTPVHGGIDPFLELDDQGGVACRDQPEIRHLGGASPHSGKSVQQLSVNSTKATV
jgi:hypothetical protein